MILLLVASFIYFFSGEIDNTIFPAFAIVLISFGLLYQYSRSRNAPDKLKILTQPAYKVIREGHVEEIKVKNR